VRLLDLFCGAGGASAGYHAAGFDVVGVDHRPQPNYPYEFVLGDAMTFPLEGFDAIHASPPCQRFSTATGRARKAAERKAAADRWPDHLTPTRQRLAAHGVPAVVENVPGAPMGGTRFVLCGSSFGLDVRRHRLFDAIGWDPGLVPGCHHGWQTPRFVSLDEKRKDGYLASVVGVHGHANYAGERELREAAMGIDWMTPRELTQAIPPAYTAWIGEQLAAALVTTP